jgi:hypothetical protein
MHAGPPPVLVVVCKLHALQLMTSLLRTWGGGQGVDQVAGSEQNDGANGMEDDSVTACARTCSSRKGCQPGGTRPGSVSTAAK